MRHLEFAGLQLAFSLLVAFAEYLAFAFLPHAIYVCCITALALAIGVSYAKAANVDGAGQPGCDTDARVPYDEGAVREKRLTLAETFPWQACCALGALGLCSSLMYGLSPYIVGSFEAACPIAALAAFVVGLSIAIYTLKTGKNFGFSAVGAFIPMIATTGILLFAMFHEVVFVPAYLLVRIAYVLFVMLAWLQITKIYRATGTICSFIVACLAIALGELSGLGALIFFETFGLDTHVAFDVLFVVSAVVMMLAFAISLMHGGIEDAWGLVRTQAQRGEKLKAAVEAAAERYGLTKREREVATLMMRGKSGPFIQEKLCISANTFQTHTRNIYRKMDIHSRAEMETKIDKHMH